MTDQHFHVPGCRCETHDAPFLNVRDERCVEWSKIQNASIAARVDAARVEERERAEAERVEKLRAWDEIAALAAAVERVRALHRPDGGTEGPGAMCVACTPDFGTPAEDPVPFPCPTIAALDAPAAGQTAWRCEFCTIEAQRECSDSVCRALMSDEPDQPAGEGEREVRDA